MSKIRILVADDHTIVRIGLTALLSTQKDILVVGEAKNGDEAICKATCLNPDIIIMDLIMPHKDGVSAITELKEKTPDVKIIVLTSFATSDDISHALNAGADGAVLKTDDDNELITAIRTIITGGRFISPQINQMLKQSPPVPVLTERQQYIVSYIAKGLTNNEKYEKPKFVDPLRYHPEIQVIGGGQLMDIETGEIYEDWADYNRKTEQDFKNKIEDAMKKPKPQTPQTTDVEPPDREYDTMDDDSYAVKVDNFVEAVSPAYVSKNSSKGTRDAADLASTIREVEHKYGTKAAAQLIESIPSDITGKIQNSNSKERYEADEAALEFAYEFLFSHTYDSKDEEWIE